MESVKKYKAVFVEYDLTKNESINAFILCNNDIILKQDLFVAILGNNRYIDRCANKMSGSNIVFSKHSTNNPDMSECYKPVLNKEGKLITLDIDVNQIEQEISISIDKFCDNLILTKENIIY